MPGREGGRQGGRKGKKERGREGGREGEVYEQYKYSRRSCYFFFLILQTLLPFFLAAASEVFTKC
jgi:hypothetical protein